MDLKIIAGIGVGVVALLLIGEALTNPEFIPTILKSYLGFAYACRDGLLGRVGVS